jgi:hypothetical protein
MDELIRLSGDELSTLHFSLLRCPSNADGSGMSIIASYWRGEGRFLKVLDGRLIAE